LTSRIAYLLQEDPKARILAVTFTKKAANEMQLRLEALLKEAAVSSPRREMQPKNDYTDSQVIVEEEHSEDDGSSAYLRDLARVSMGTFHKVSASSQRFPIKFCCEETPSYGTVLEGLC
jgi:superfamily I DNA/RNA helicase